MKPDPWHFPRPTFAKETLSSLMHGPFPAMRLFGARRMGKTTFLLSDLGPVAAAAGHRVVYSSFWQNPSAPLAALLFDCDTALRKKTFTLELPGRLPIRAKLGWGAAATEIDFSARDNTTLDTQINLLDMYLDRLSNRKRPALLLLDEVQELAAAPHGAIIVAALRTGLDKRRDGLRSVFTGSSQIKLDKLFSDRTGPFYRFAAPLTLPPLGDAFVDHQCAAFEATFRRNLKREDALRALEQFGGMPSLFQRWLIALGMNPNLSEQDAAAQVLKDLTEQMDFERVWLELSRVQRAVARLLAERLQGLFGSAVESRLEELIGHAPPPSVRQSAIRHLQRQGRADQFDREWRLADPLFEAWVLQRPNEEF